MTISSDGFDDDGRNRRSFRRQQVREGAEYLAATNGGEVEAHLAEADRRLPIWPAPYRDDDLTNRGFELKAEYDYTNPDGKRLYQVVRYEYPHVKGAKTFRQRSPAPAFVAGPWIADAGLVKVIYRWPDIIRRPNEDVWFFEGEKDVERAIAEGLLATTVASQAWSLEAAKALIGRNVIICTDNDKSGGKNETKAIDALRGFAASIRIVRLPGVTRTEDLSDWLDKGHTKVELLEISGRTPTLALVPRVVNPADWENVPVPARVFLIEPLIPADNVGLLYGDGGLGKSVLALMAAAARSSGKPWLGLDTTPGKTIVVSAEDDLNEMHRRLDAIARQLEIKMSDLGLIRLVDLVGQDAVIGDLSRNGRIEATELYHFLLRQIDEFRPSLMIVDALADSFAGDENNRVQARQFVSLLRRPAMDYHCAFLALAHPSLSGINTGRGTSGTTGWSNSVRSRMYFSTVEVEGKEPDPNLKVLRQPKANYAPAGFELVVRYQDGVFVPALTGVPLDRIEKEKQAEGAFMTILNRLFDQERFVNNVRGINYAPKVFSEEPEAMTAMISKAQLTAAMIRLFSDNRIKMEGYGPPSRAQKRIVFNPTI